MNRPESPSTPQCPGSPLMSPETTHYLLSTFRQTLNLKPKQTPAQLRSKADKVCDEEQHSINWTRKNSTLDNVKCNSDNKQNFLRCCVRAPSLTHSTLEGELAAWITNQTVPTCYTLKRSPPWSNTCYTLKRSLTWEQYMLILKGSFIALRPMHVIPRRGNCLWAIVFSGFSVTRFYMALLVTQSFHFASAPERGRFRKWVWVVILAREGGWEREDMSMKVIRGRIKVILVSRQGGGGGKSRVHEEALCLVRGGYSRLYCWDVTDQDSRC